MLARFSRFLGGGALLVAGAASSAWLSADVPDRSEAAQKAAVTAIADRAIAEMQMALSRWRADACSSRCTCQGAWLRTRKVHGGARYCRRSSHRLLCWSRKRVSCLDAFLERCLHPGR